MALDSNGLELLNRQPEAHVSVDNMLVLIGKPNTYAI